MVPTWGTAIAGLAFLHGSLEAPAEFSTVDYDVPHRCPTKVSTSSSRQFFWATLPTTFRRRPSFPLAFYHRRRRSSLSCLRQNRQRSSSHCRRPSIRQFRSGFVLRVSYSPLLQTMSSSRIFTTRLHSIGGRGALQLQIRAAAARFQAPRGFQNREQRYVGEPAGGRRQLPPSGANLGPALPPSVAPVGGDHRPYSTGPSPAPTALSYATSRRKAATTGRIRIGRG